MSAFCRKCGKNGHVQDYCPLNFRSSQPRRQDENGNRWTAEKKPRSSNIQRLPQNWKLSDMYGGSFKEAIAGLQSEGRKFNMQDVEHAEFQAINDLVQRTWQGRKVGLGIDGANLDHTSIEVVKIQRIENPGLYKKYSMVKHNMLQEPKNEWASIYKPVELIKRGTRSIWTTRAIKQDSFLRPNFFTPINEHYLFHGTKEGNVMSIAENGFNINLCLDRGLMGAAIYFAECSTKADMYADYRHKRTTGKKHMLLVRVLLGSSYVNTEKTKIPLEHPPCRDCLQHHCSCEDEDYFDSVVDDSGRIFRVFAVYESDLCYPEYLITYERGYGDEGTDAVSRDLPRSSLLNGQLHCARTARATKQTTTKKTTTVTNVAVESAARSQHYRRFSIPAERASSVLRSSSVTRDPWRDPYLWSSPSRPSLPEDSGWSVGPPATYESLQWSNGIPSRPQPFVSSADRTNSSNDSRGFFGWHLFCCFLFFFLLYLSFAGR